MTDMDEYIKKLDADEIEKLRGRVQELESLVRWLLVCPVPPKSSAAVRDRCRVHGVEVD